VSAAGINDLYQSGSSAVIDWGVDNSTNTFAWTAQLRRNDVTANSITTVSTLTIGTQSADSEVYVDSSVVVGRTYEYFIRIYRQGTTTQVTAISPNPTARSSITITAPSPPPTPPPPPPPATPVPVFSDAAAASPAIRGVEYTDGVTANNTNSYSVFSGALPTGILLNTSTGAITGTPTTLGTSTFVIRATGNGGNTNTETLTIVVNPPAPVFSDQAITTSWIKTRNFDAAPDRTVVASDVASYSIVYSGTGLNPTSWLTINSSGQLSGLPPALGAYTFVVRATNVTGSTDSTLKTLTINPPGNRRDATNFQTDMILTKRYTGTQWVNVTTFKRYNGTAWVDIVN
jgi:hypothetical protein